MERFSMMSTRRLMQKYNYYLNHKMPVMASKIAHVIFGRVYNTRKDKDSPK